MIHDRLELPTREQAMANSAASASAKGEQAQWQKPRMSEGHICAQCAESYNIEGVNASAHATMIHVLRETRTRFVTYIERHAHVLLLIYIYIYIYIYIERERETHTYTFIHT